MNDSSAVGCFEPNGYGLHDMLGNLWEWTSSARLRSVAKDESVAIGLGQLESVKSLVVRGGSWISSADYARCAYRGNLHPAVRNYDLGLRVVLRSSPVSKR